MANSQPELSSSRNSNTISPQIGKCIRKLHMTHHSHVGDWATQGLRGKGGKREERQEARAERGEGVHQPGSLALGLGAVHSILRAIHSTLWAVHSSRETRQHTTMCSMVSWQSAMQRLAAQVGCGTRGAQHGPFLHTTNRKLGAVANMTASQELSNQDG